MRAIVSASLTGRVKCHSTWSAKARERSSNGVPASTGGSSSGTTSREKGLGSGISLYLEKKLPQVANMN